MRKKYEVMDKFDDNVELIRWLTEREPDTEFYLPIKRVEGMAHNRLCYNSGAAYYMAYLPYTRQSPDIIGPLPNFNEFLEDFLYPLAAKMPLYMAVCTWTSGPL